MSFIYNSIKQYFSFDSWSKINTQSILIKLATSGKPHISNSSFSKEGYLIEFTKENEVEIEEKDLKVIHTNSSSNVSHESNDKNYEEEENDKMFLGI